MAKFSIPDLPEKENLKGILIKIPSSLHDDLRRTCERNDVTMQFVVEQMIRHCLSEMKGDDK